MKTYVYVDGFNFYFGSVKGTPNKWLNIRKLCETLPVLPCFQWVPPEGPMSPMGIHLNSRRCNLRWTDLTITTLKGADIHGENQCSAPTGLDRIVPEFHGLHPRLFMVQSAGLNSSTRKPIENVEEPT